MNTSSSGSSSSEGPNYPFLMLAHLVCADQQIHSHEVQRLQEIGLLRGLDPLTLQEMDKILGQSEDALPLDYLAGKVTPSDRQQTIEQLLEIAGADNYFALREREQIEAIAKAWGWSDMQISMEIEIARKIQAQAYNNKKRSSRQVSFCGKTWKLVRKILPEAFFDHAVKSLPKKIVHQVEQLQREIFIAGPEYDAAIQKCRTVAQEDYEFAKDALTHTIVSLSTLVDNLEAESFNISQRDFTGKASEAKAIVQQLKASIKSLQEDILRNIKSVEKSLHAKQRALKYFTIAFMGRTKAGKSTLHAVVTDWGWEGIGAGGQRTTRFNRVYEWENIRIIDTPGIGAPGGKTDEEIAASVIDEADIICFVVTNDSTQGSEFKFLQKLKEQAKPLVILLNIKHDLRNPKRLERFLSNPDKLFAVEGSSGLGGHFKRIREYASKHYANDFFDIMPVMLLAAQMSKEKEHEAIKDKLFRASHLQDFLDSIRLSLIENGMIRRSQTMLGSTVGAISNPKSAITPYEWICQQHKDYEDLLKLLKKKREETQVKISQLREDLIESLKVEIQKVFQDVYNAIHPFAESYWDTSESAMKAGWERKLENINFHRQIENAYKHTGEMFNTELLEILEEIGKELELVYQLQNHKFRHEQQDSDVFFKNFFRIGGPFLGLIGGVVLFVSPIGWIIGAIGIVFSLISNFFESKMEKRRKAVERISISLKNQVDEQRNNILKTIEAELRSNIDLCQLKVENYFCVLIDGLEPIYRNLSEIKIKLDAQVNYLNHAYAKRVLDWCTATSITNAYQPLKLSGIQNCIKSVIRDLGNEMIIETQFDIPIVKKSEEINRILQEKVIIKTETHRNFS